VGNYVNEKYLRLDYVNKQNSIDDKPYRVGERVTNRPNHGLAHSIRQSIYVPLVADYLLKTKGGESLGNPAGELIFDTDHIRAMQVTTLFMPTGRENEDDSPGHAQWKVGAGYLKTYLNSESFRNNPLFAPQRQFLGKNLQQSIVKYGILHDETSKAANCVKLLAHRLDGLRCRSNFVFSPDTYFGLTEDHALVKFVLDCIEATGDRIMFPDDRRRDRTEKFIDCNTNIDTCLQSLIPVIERHFPDIAGDVSQRCFATRQLTFETTALYQYFQHDKGLYTDSLEESTKADQHHEKIFDLKKMGVLDLMNCTTTVIKAFCTKYNIDDSEMLKFSNSMALPAKFDSEKNQSTIIQSLAVHLWTSGKKLKGKTEFCSILNTAIRENWQEKEVVQATYRIIRCMNSLLINRRDDVQAELPEDGLYRGGGLPKDKRTFFENMKGKHYRIPGFLATTSEEKTARRFCRTAQTESKLEPVLWKVRQPKYDCFHVSYVGDVSTFGDAEKEFLFVPYSVFKVVDFVWKKKPYWSGGVDDDCGPHVITLEAQADNASPDFTENHLPLAPWS